GVNNTYHTGKLYRAIIGGYLDYEVVSGLHLKGNVGFDGLYTRTNRHLTDIIRVSRQGVNQQDDEVTLNLNATLSYDKALRSHTINAVAGVERQNSTYYSGLIAFENLISPDNFIGRPLSTSIMYPRFNHFPDFRIQGYFARANYTFRDRYLVGVSFRRDGASVFGLQNRWGNFPAISAGWILSEETFGRKLGPVNFLKIRASYGATGNANIPKVIYDTYSTTPNFGLSGGYGISGFGSPDIGWENVRTVDASLEFGAFQNRITGSAGFYRQEVSDMLLQTPIPQSQGGPGSVWANIGSLRNAGVEAQLNTVNVTAGAFKWSTNVNLTTVDNKTLRLTPRLDQNGQGIVNGGTITRTGGPLGTYYLAESAGVDPATGYELIYEIDQNTLRETGQTVKTGNTILATPTNLNNNRVILEGKTGSPTYFGGLSNTFSFKGLDLTVLFTFQGGNYLYDDIHFLRVDGSSNVRADAIGHYWREDNPNARYPRLTLSNVTRDKVGLASLAGQTTMRLQEGSFVRLRNAQLGYTLPVSLTSKINCKGARIYVSGTNLFTFTNYQGFDPEVGNIAEDQQGRNLRAGFVENPLFGTGAPFPQVRTFIGGINVTF
ncbi:MAG: SusC/RagA family TonB-linked outer membrane protein, partial [Ferruginibacter sp.]|nr:SusC/RagA family TonB-linked outer membrane protein [Cytophagales bacterium]